MSRAPPLIAGHSAGANGSRDVLIGLETATVSVASLAFLVVLGAVGANKMKAAIRVTFWGALAMVVTARTGAIFGAHV